MPFTVEDFEDLLRLLAERPDWRTRLRDLILPPELFDLPKLAEELVEANRIQREQTANLQAEQKATRKDLTAFRTETNERFDRVDERFDRVEGRVGKVESDLAAFRTEANERFDRMDDRFDRMDRRFDFADVRAQQLSTDIGTIKGQNMEIRYREHVDWFEDFVVRPVALSVSEANSLIRHEVEAGHLSRPEGRVVALADLILRGGDDDAPTYLVVEVSWQVNERDVLRARDRAALLRKAGHTAQGVVAGQRILESALALADRLGVGQVIEEEMEKEFFPLTTDDS